MRRGLPVVLTALLLSGCGLFDGGAPVVEPTPLQPLSDQALTVEEVWEQGAGEGSPHLYSGLRADAVGGTVYTAGAEGLVSAFRVEDGEELWRTETETRITGGPSVVGNLVVFGTLDGQVVALDRESGEPRWRVGVSSNVLSPPAGANGIVVARAEDGRVFGFDAGSGERIWSYNSTVPRLSLRGTSRPVTVDESVLIAQDNGQLVSLVLSDGRVNWEVPVAMPSGQSEIERLVDLDAEIAVADGDLVFAASYDDVMAAVTVRTGRPVWRRDIGSVTGVAAPGRNVYVTGPAGTVWALDAVTGTTLWSQDALRFRDVTAPVVQDQWVVVADGQGYVHWLSREDGRVVGRIEADGDGIASAPVAAGERLLVLGKGGELSALAVAPEDDNS